MAVRKKRTVTRYGFVVQDIPVRVIVEADTVTVNAGMEGSTRRVVWTYTRARCDLGVMTEDIAKGLAISAAAAWHKTDTEGGW